MLIGKAPFLHAQKVTGIEPLEAAAAQLQEQGQGAMFVALDGRAAAVLVVSDPILRFPNDGVLITSSREQFGWASDESYFVDSTGTRVSSAPMSGGSDSFEQRGGHTINYSIRYVGTDAGRKSAPSSAPKIDEIFTRLYPDG